MSATSPFPGMDPFLQGRWADVHAKLIAYIGEALTPLLPRDLRARSEERVLLESSDGEALRRYRSDVSVVESGYPGPSRTTVASSTTIEPVIVKAARPAARRQRCRLGFGMDSGEVPIMLTFPRRFRTGRIF